MHILFLSGIVKMDRSDLIFKIMQNIFEDDPGVTLCIDHLIITKWSVLMVVVFLNSQFDHTFRNFTIMTIHAVKLIALHFGIFSHSTLGLSLKSDLYSVIAK